MNLSTLIDEERIRFEKEIPHYYPNSWIDIKVFLEDSNRRIAEATAKAGELSERLDPGDFGSHDDKLIREQWWGREAARREQQEKLTAWMV